MDFCFPLFILLIVSIIGVWFALQTSTENGKKLKALKDAYETSLKRLRVSPTDPDLREQTLQLGRYYAQYERELLSATSEKLGITIFDEVALKNDIDAACAGGVKIKELAPSTNRDEIDCPFCAERILRKAIVCKHCGRDVTSS